jgi:hypothetical protein
MPLMVNGDFMEDAEILDLIRMIHHDTQEIAGQFFEQRRSRKFRRHFQTEGHKRGMSAETWFVTSEWKNFEGAIPAYYGETLNENSTIYEKNEDVRTRRFKALILISMMTNAKNGRQAGGVQVAPGTQAFDGDKTDNKFISESFGDGSTLH